MKLQDALTLNSSNKYLVRKKWIEDGNKMKLLTSAKTLEEILDKYKFILSKESLNADDWEVLK